jgi:glycine/D-amino acid oxidase-like deaminating enzyme
LVKTLRRRLPSVDFVPDYTWAGTFGASKDSLPFVGPHPKFPYSYFVLGFGGNGITFTVMSMEIISDAVAGRPNRFLNYFKFNR